MNDECWFDTWENVVVLAEWLDAEGAFDDNAALFYMLRKPWKYNAEWREYQKAKVQA